MASQDLSLSTPPTRRRLVVPVVLKTSSLATNDDAWNDDVSILDLPFLEAFSGRMESECSPYGKVAPVDRGACVGQPSVNKMANFTLQATICAKIFLRIISRSEDTRVQSSLRRMILKH